MPTCNCSSSFSSRLGNEFRPFIRLSSSTVKFSYKNSRGLFNFNSLNVAIITGDGDDWKIRRQRQGNKLSLLSMPAKGTFVSGGVSGLQL
jgi:hypothetical protein